MKLSRMIIVTLILICLSAQIVLADVSIFGSDPHCSDGPEHHICYTDTDRESCGCYTRYYKCCCGKIVEVHRGKCPDHPY
ncbi:hypothetical protein R9X47_00830 [Wukongibacter baidiensis]|uniref:hypothetical protein n=1 Tax=Wukongibacter baidiensis TaxID=1723361 RepID=UPI003D7F98BE